MNLSNPNNWSLIFSTNLQANLAAQYGTGPGAVLIFDPIPSVQTSLGTPVGLVRCSSQTANPKWFLGCWLNAFQQFAGQKVRIFSKKCSLKTATFLELPNFGQFPYEIEFSIPDWMEDLRIELWQFTEASGRYIPVEDQVIFTAIEILDQRVKSGVLNPQSVGDTNPK